MRARSLLSIVPLLLVLGLWQGAQGAVQIVDGPKVETTESSAVVRWKTDTECGARVSFGLGPKALTLGKMKAPGVGVDHEISLSGLQPGTAYYYEVGTARLPLATGVFTTRGKGGKPTPLPPPAVVKKDTPKVAPSLPPAPAPKMRAAPPTSKIWGNLSSLPDHFARHGGDFGATSQDDYARKAWEFFQRAIAEGLPAKLDESDDTLRIWDGRSGTFGAYHTDGRAKTFFKPGSRGYFDRQPGQLVNLKPKH